MEGDRRVGALAGQSDDVATGLWPVAYARWDGPQGRGYSRLCGITPLVYGVKTE